MNLAGIVTDENSNMEVTTSLIATMVDQLQRVIDEDFHRPVTFIGVGEHMVFRDLINNTQAIFREDHKFYKKHGLYDYPRKGVKKSLSNFILRVAMMIPPVRNKIYKNMNKMAVQQSERIIKRETVSG